MRSFDHFSFFFSADSIINLCHFSVTIITTTVETAIIIKNGNKNCFQLILHSRIPTVAGTNIMDMVSIRKLPVPSTLSIFTTPDWQGCQHKKRLIYTCRNRKGRIWLKILSQSDSQDNTDLSYVFHLCFPPDVLRMTIFFLRPLFF